MPRLHEAVASPCQAARPYSAASRCAWWHQSITAFAPTGWTGFQLVATAEYRHGQTARVSSSAAGGLRALVLHPRCGHTLRFYIRPHFSKCGAVVPLKLHLVPRTATRPRGFLKQALCKVASTPSCGVLRFGYLARRFAQVFGQWPAAIRGRQPPPTPGPRRCAALAPRGLPIRPPRGLPQSALQGRAPKPIAGFARNAPIPPSKIAATKDVAISPKQPDACNRTPIHRISDKKSPEQIRAFFVH